MRAKTLYDKLYDRHLVRDEVGEDPILFIDRHLVHEVTSPQAFDGLRVAGRTVRDTKRTFATMDHNVSTRSREISSANKMGKIQLQTLVKNCLDFNVTLYDLKDPHQGIVHVIGAELGVTLPGTSIVCGDSHTATHGAFGALAFGIGTSEVEQVLATQTLYQKRLKNMKVEITGTLSPYVTAKDVILSVIGELGTAGGTGYAVEYCGSVVRDLSMEGRMTLCNMAIEMGAKVGVIAPDQKSFDYLKGKEFSPKGEVWESAVKDWQLLNSDEGVSWDSELVLRGEDIEPQVTWGTNPGQVAGVHGRVPNSEDFNSEGESRSCQNALQYMGLEGGTPISEISVDKVFIGSCTNGRIEDLRMAANIAKGTKVAKGVRAMVVPGSAMVRLQAEREGLDKIFLEAGYEWRFAGCSMCLGMNDDILQPGERCASTSNRNFEGRQGRGARTHLVSPAMAAAAAANGHFVDVREFKG